MPIRLAYSTNEHLPKLAWLGHLEPRAETLTVHAGEWVERGAQFVVEGAWSGPYAEGDLDRTDAIFGSGCRVRGDSCTFVSSTSTTDSLFYSALDAGGVAVSNSLPFLLAFLGDELDPQYRGYAQNNASIILGIDRYERSLPTRKGSVRRLLFRNLRVTGAEIVEEDKPFPQPFPTFGAYEACLEGRYAALVENARHPRRRVPMAVFSTQSRGYDTTAINAIAARHGIDMVFTCTKSKGKGAYADADAASQDDDDGSEIAAALGLDCTPIDRREFERSFDQEYLYHASLHASQDANLMGVNPFVQRPSLLLTGTLGELWYPEDQYRDRSGDFHTHEMRRWDLGGHGMTEVRLTVGLVQAAIPYIGAQRRSDIFRITHSDEMAPWRLGTHYDRPIPRRIAEERGVPRHLFGQQKLASVVQFAMPGVPYTPRLREEYRRFLLRNGVAGRWQFAVLPLVRRVNTFLTFHSATRYYVQRALSLLSRRDVRPRLWTWLDGTLFCFGVNKRIADYRGALAEDSGPSAGSPPEEPASVAE